MRYDPIEPQHLDEVEYSRNWRELLGSRGGGPLDSLTSCIMLWAWSLAAPERIKKSSMMVAWALLLSHLVKWNEMKWNKYTIPLQQGGLTERLGGDTPSSKHTIPSPKVQFQSPGPHLNGESSWVLEQYCTHLFSLTFSLSRSLYMSLTLDWKKK